VKRILSSLVALLFAVGMLIVPTVHHLHCEEAGHHVDDCPVCQMAGAPLDTAVTQTVVVGVPAVEQVLSAAAPANPAARVSHDATQPRAPPVA
jgi:primosomal protein N'